MAAADYTPTLADVGALIRARTKDTDGNELGTFTANTRPTATQVTAEIAQAVDEVWAVLGQSPIVVDPAVPSEFQLLLYPRAKRAATLYAAMLVELSYFPEQIDTDQSPYDRLKELYDAAIGRLAASVSSDPGDSQGFGSIAVMSPTAAAYTGTMLGIDLFVLPEA